MFDRIRSFLGIMETTPKTCATCRFWKPVNVYHMGQCLRANHTDCKFLLIDEEGVLLTNIGFGCIQHEDPPPIDKDII